MASGLGQLTAGFGALKAGALGVIAAVAPLRGVLDEVGRINDVSARIGASVRDVVALERAFTAAGLSAAEVPAYLARMQRALGGVNEEGTATGEAFARLGLSMQELRLQGPIEQLEAVSRALGRLPDQAARARAVQDIFGRGASALLPLLGDAGALPGARADTAQLGAMTQRNAARMDRLGDELGLLRVRLMELGVAMVERLLPSMERLAEVIRGANAGAAGSALGGALPGLVGAYATRWLSQRPLVRTALRAGSSAVAGAMSGLGLSRRTATTAGLLVRRTPLLALTGAVGGAISGGWEGANAGMMDDVESRGNDIGALTARLGTTRSLAALEQLRAETLAAQEAARSATGWFSTLLTLGGTRRAAQGNEAAGARLLAAIEQAVPLVQAREAEDRAAAAAETAAARGEAQRTVVLASAEDTLARAQMRRAQAQQEVERTRGGGLAAAADEEARAALEALARAQREYTEALRASLPPQPVVPEDVRDPAFAEQIAALRRWNEARRQVLEAEREAVLLERERDTLAPLDIVGSRAPGSLGEALTVGVENWLEQVRSPLEQVAELISDSIGTAVRGVSDGIYGWITGTATWASALRSVGQSLLRALIDQVVQMGVQWIITGAIGRSVMLAWDALKSALTAADVARENAAETAKMPAKATNALLSSIGSWGVAVAVGIAALIAGMAMFGGFRDGGYTGAGGTDQVAGLVHRGEYVMPASAVDRYGVGYFDRVAQGEAPAAGVAPVTIAFVGSAEDGRAWLRGREGRRFLADAARQAVEEV